MPISALQIDGGLTQRDEFCLGDGTLGRKIIELGKRRAGDLIPTCEAINDGKTRWVPEAPSRKEKTKNPFM